METQTECSDAHALVFVVIGSWKNYVIGLEDGEWRLVHYHPGWYVKIAVSLLAERKSCE